MTLISSKLVNGYDPRREAKFTIVSLFVREQNNSYYEIIKEDLKMIILTILAIVAFALAIVLGTIGLGFIAVFADLIVAILAIVIIVKIIKKIKKKG